MSGNPPTPLMIGIPLEVSRLLERTESVLRKVEAFLDGMIQDRSIAKFEASVRLANPKGIPWTGADSGTSCASNNAPGGSGPQPPDEDLDLRDSFGGVGLTAEDHLKAKREFEAGWKREIDKEIREVAQAPVPQPPSTVGNFYPEPGPGYGEWLVKNRLTGGVIYARFPECYMATEETNRLNSQVVGPAPEGQPAPFSPNWTRYYLAAYGHSGEWAVYDGHGWSEDGNSTRCVCIYPNREQAERAMRLYNINPEPNTP
jgi:hypothetical protein